MADNVLIINLTRFGDLLQTQPLLSGLADNGHRCGLLCLGNFAEALPLLRHVDDAWPLRAASLLANLSRNWPRAVAMITDFVKEIRSSVNYSYIVNLTPANPARLLASMLARDGAKVLGFGMDEEGFGVNSGAWAAFLNVSSKRRGNSPFNVADIFRMTALPLLGSGIPAPDAGHLGEPPDEARAWADDFLLRHARKWNKLVALQLGASNPHRQWPVEHFAEFAAKLDEKGYGTLLVGSPAERKLADEFADRTNFPFVDTVGKTSLGQLAAILGKCDLLATNDTGTMHLASGLGVKCLAFFLATAQPWDTGPYASGSCCLEPALACHPCSFNNDCGFDHACRGQIKPSLAVTLAQGFLETGNWPAFGCDSARIWLTGHDNCGFANVSCLSGHEKYGKSAWLAWLRYFWRQMLDDIAGAKLECASICPEFSAPEEYIKDALPVLRQVASILESIQGVGQLLGKNPKAGAILLEGCEKVQILLDLCPPLSSLGDFWRELRNDSNDIPKFMRQIALISKHMKSFAADLETAG